MTIKEKTSRLVFVRGFVVVLHHNGSLKNHFHRAMQIFHTGLLNNVKTVAVMSAEGGGNHG